MKSDSLAIKQRYERIAPYFDGCQAIMEGFFYRRWRKKLWAKVDGLHILEVGYEGFYVSRLGTIPSNKI